MDGASVDLSSFENIWAEIYSQYDWLINADYLDKSNLLNYPRVFLNLKVF